MAQKEDENVKNEASEAVEEVVEEEATEEPVVEEKVEEPKVEEPAVVEADSEVPESKYQDQPMDNDNFAVGDTVVVHYRITEGGKTRIQPYEGIVISKKGESMSKTFMVRRIGADGIGVERIFPLHSPNIEKIDVKKKGKVRRAKLYYLREKKGREAYRVKEKKS